MVAEQNSHKSSHFSKAPGEISGRQVTVKQENLCCRSRCHLMACLAFRFVEAGYQSIPKRFTLIVTVCQGTHRGTSRWLFGMLRKPKIIWFSIYNILTLHSHWSHNQPIRPVVCLTQGSFWYKHRCLTLASCLPPSPDFCLFWFILFSWFLTSSCKHSSSKSAPLCSRFFYCEFI